MDFQLACARCGGSLRGCELDGACPQCRAGVSQTLNTSVIDSGTMTVCDDVACRRCDYNLRTLAIGSVCPECGSEVVLSLSPDPLRSAGRDWLRAAWRGVAILTVVAAVHLCLQSALSLGLSLGQPLGYFWRYTYPIHLALWLIWCVGVFLVARKERHRPIWAPGERIASWARGAAAATAAAGPLVYLIGVYWNWLATGQISLWPAYIRSQPSMGFVYGLTAISAVTVALSTGALILVLLYLRLLIRQAGRGKRLETVAVWVALANGMVRAIYYGPVTFIVLQDYVHSSGSTPSSMLRDVATAVHDSGEWVLTLAGLPVWFLAYLVFWRCRRMFREALRDDRGKHSRL